MFDLNRAIAEWRQDMVAGGVEPVEALNELEGHLRDHFEEMVQTGHEDQEAFTLAAEQLGRSADLAAEFQKLQPSGWLPTKVATAFILIALAGMVVLVSGWLRSGKMELLLACHVFSITVGYFSALVVGGLGICYVCERSAKGFLTKRKELLSRAAFRFTSFSTVLTAVGVVLGAIWAKDHWGRFWGWDVKEVGGLAVTSWLLLGLAMQWCKVGTHATMILSVAGNIVVALAWFGANMLIHGIGSNGVVAYTLAAFVACNLVFLLIGFLPARALFLRRR